MRYVLETVFARRTRPAASRRPEPLRFRPTLEPLDDRWVPSGFRQTNLVADEPGVARITDPELVGGWGLSLSQAGGAFWVSANRTGVSTLYTGDVNGSAFNKAFTVVLPGGAPTGQVFNGSADFVVRSGTASGQSIFLFAGEAGFVTGWNPGVPPSTPPPSRLAQVGVNQAGQSGFTGLAIGNNGTGNFLYAADFQNGKISVFNSTFQPVTLAGNFRDPNMKAGYVPFNVQNLNGKLYVTYAKQDRRGDLADGGNGFVSVFDLNGNFLDRLVSNDHLKSPWGVAIAPADFGEFGGALLVANHGDGRINAYHAQTGDFLGRLRDERGRPIRIDGLYGIAFGNGVSAGDRNALYFAASPRDGRDGLFGSLRAAPGGSVAMSASAAPVVVQQLESAPPARDADPAPAEAPAGPAKPSAPAAVVPLTGGSGPAVDPLDDVILGGVEV